MGSGNTGVGHKGTFDKDYGNVKTSRKKNISQEAVDKIVYDVLSSDQGLSALATSENASGGFGSSTKALMAQDLIAKITGEIGKITAEDVTNERTDKASQKQEFSESGKTVICTYLATQGYIPILDYTRAFYYYDVKLNPIVYAGYCTWAVHVVKWMKKYPFICNILRPVIKSRYDMILSRKKFTLLGGASIYIGQPICYLIGLFITLPGYVQWQLEQK
jgi:hypothetical protein